MLFYLDYYSAIYFTEIKLEDSDFEAYEDKTLLYIFIFLKDILWFIFYGYNYLILEDSLLISLQLDFFLTDSYNYRYEFEFA